MSEEVTTVPVGEVTATGTYAGPIPAKQQMVPPCNPNYGGACVPIASDVDCAGGGDGTGYE